MSIPYFLLALLAEGPKYGLQLREEFEAGTGEVWPLNVGQVYRTGWLNPTVPGKTDRRSGS
jgi:DNA-binding PadR family transcriptional regulator